MALALYNQVGPYHRLISGLAEKGKMLNRQVYDLTKEFQKSNSCCITCYSKLMKKLQEQKEMQEAYIQDLKWDTESCRRVLRDFPSDVMLSLTTPISICIEQTHQLEKQITQKIQSLRKKICLKEALSVASSICSRGLKRSYQVLKEIGNASWNKYIVFEDFQDLIKDKIKATVYSRRSYTSRDYIIPLAVVGSALYQAATLLYERREEITFYSFPYASHMLYAELFLLGIFGVEQLLDKIGLNTNCGERYKRYISETHPFHTDIITPIVEEIFYRGLLQNGLSLVTGSPNLGLIVSSFLFGRAHFYSHEKGNYGHAFVTGFGSLAIMGMLCKHYGILYSIYSHSLWNSLCSLSEWASSEKPDAASPQQLIH